MDRITFPVFISGIYITVAHIIVAAVVVIEGLQSKVRFLVYSIFTSCRF